MIETLRILALSDDGSTEQVSLTPSTVPPWSLVVSGLGMQDQAFEGSDLFDALIALRKQLEGVGFRMLCAGARRDVYPSGMAKSMGGARKAYILQVGSPATGLVDIFAEARPEQVGTVVEQQQFRQQWMNSLREKM